MSVNNVVLEMERGVGGMGIRKVSQVVEYSDFTDGGSTSGTLNLRKKIPAGSFVIGSKVKVIEGFTGDTSCTLDIGTASDADAFSLTTHNIYTAADNLLEAADYGGGGSAGFYLITSDTTVKLTATSASDWGSVSAGKMEVDVFYLSTNPELTD